MSDDYEKLKPNINEAFASGVTAIVDDLLTGSKFSQALETLTHFPEDYNCWVAVDVDILGEVPQDVEFMSTGEMAPELTAPMLLKDAKAYADGFEARLWNCVNSKDLIDAPHDDNSITAVCLRRVIERSIIGYRGITMNKINLQDLQIFIGNESTTPMHLMGHHLLRVTDVEDGIHTKIPEGKGFTEVFPKDCYINTQQLIKLQKENSNTQRPVDSIMGSDSVVNNHFHKALKHLKDLSMLEETDDNQVFECIEITKSYLYFMVKVACCSGRQLTVTFDDTRTRIITKDDYWHTIANYLWISSITIVPLQPAPESVVDLDIIGERNNVAHLNFKSYTQYLYSMLLLKTGPGERNTDGLHVAMTSQYINNKEPIVLDGERYCAVYVAWDGGTCLFTVPGTYVSKYREASLRFLSTKIPSDIMVNEETLTGNKYAELEWLRNFLES